VYERLHEYDTRVAVAYPEITIGSVAQYLGAMAAAIERWDDASADFELALETNARIGARPWLARTQRDYARALLARDEPGDRDRAAALDSEAAATEAELGMQPPTSSSR
jgi:hypothetical protein